MGRQGDEGAESGEKECAHESSLLKILRFSHSDTTPNGRLACSNKA
jgi:hypothetical protein